MAAASILTSPFDLTFDFTFQSLIPVPANIIASDCRLPGVHLYWLSHRYWASFLFQGNSEWDIEAKSLGLMNKGGLNLDTQRQGTSTLIVRGGSLLKEHAQVVKTIFLSPAVFAIAPGPDNKLKACQVRVDEGSYPVDRDARARIDIEFKISFPTLTAQRA